jgi:hypothetical protein
MRAPLFTAFLALCGVPLLAQTPASPSQVHTSDIGYSYSLPADWEVVDTTATLPQVQQQVGKTASSETEKKGIACVQIGLTARHGTPSSVVVVVALPFACFGQTMTEKDLPGFAMGASEGIKNTFDLSDALHSSYKLGSHGVWVERAKGTLRDNPEVKYTVETACSILKKGAVCWMSMAADEDALQTFEHGSVALDGEAPATLVPADAFAKKP